MSYLIYVYMCNCIENDPTSYDDSSAFLVLVAFIVDLGLFVAALAFICA